MNHMTFEKLQYNEVKEIVKSFCVSNLGKQLIDNLVPSANPKVVQNRLLETSEARAIVDTGSRIPFMGLTGIDTIMENLEKGIILNPEKLMQVYEFLRSTRKIKQFMSEKAFYAPSLSAYGAGMIDFRNIEEEIISSIEGGQVATTASKELKRIRGGMSSVEEKIKERLNYFMKHKEYKKYIQEFFVSKKGDHYTIPIKAAYKNQVPGTIIEQSAKGATVFIEPSAVTKLNAELGILKVEENMEEYQILSTLSGLILENLNGINANIELISHYDMVFAKAKYSRSIDGIQPKINNYGYIKLVHCKHPLLSGDKVVPLNFEIGDAYRSLIITGPNAGGKTIVLKTIGLLTLSVMSGFHISGAPGTEVALFDQVFVDIGDNQSLENALSTFSSHIKNLSDIMKIAKNNTLLIFDEIGSGTEPNEGAALAIAILEEFYQIGCITVATTHYGEIKRYSETHSDFMNAAMQFNKDSLTPTYQLLIGKSGDSNALWISKKMELKDSVLEKAKRYMEEKEYSLERVADSKRMQPPIAEKIIQNEIQYQKGDRVLLFDYNESGIVYSKLDKYNNLKVFYKNEIQEINVKRVKFEVSARELYPDNYDLDTLFTDFKTRKLEHDLARGSKKARKKIAKETKKK